MKTTCPQCSVHIDIDAATHAALAGQSHFVCPACQGAVLVPALVRPRPQLNLAPGSHATAPAQTKIRKKNIANVSPRKRRNFLVFGSIALLALGGIAFIIASRDGNIFNSDHRITNQIIHNSYFTQLIASGETTKKDLEAVTDIRPYDGGFIGISKESMTWNQAKAFAKRAGTAILRVESQPNPMRKSLLDWLAKSYSSHMTSPIWVSEADAACVLDGPDVLAVTTLDRKRKVFLRWGVGLAVPGASNHPSAVAQLAHKPSSEFTDSLEGTIWVVRDSLGDNDYFEFAPGGLLNYESKRGLRPNGTWRQDGSTVRIETNNGYAKLTATLSGRRMHGDGISPSSGRWTWEATPR